MENGDLLEELKYGDTFGFGYEFATGDIFFTRNGNRFPVALYGQFLPYTPSPNGVLSNTLNTTSPDVYAAIGVWEHRGTGQFWNTKIQVEAS